MIAEQMRKSCDSKAIKITQCPIRSDIIEIEENTPEALLRLILYSLFI
jgi:hypothetical protein